MNKLLILSLILILLFTAPVYSKEVTAKVDDKGLIYVYHHGLFGTLHTAYGWIIVDDEDYNQIMVNDTIKYNTDKDSFWQLCWDVEKVI